MTDFTPTRVAPRLGSGLRTRRALPLLILLGAMTLTLVVAWLLQRSSEDMRRARFEQAAAQIRHELEERVESASSILRATAALFSVDEVRSRREFREYVERLNVPLRYPGMLGVGYIQRLRHQDYQRLTASAGGAGSASFAVWPPGRRDEYYPVMLLEPRDQRNRAALGYDIATDPVRRAALEEAIQSGHPTLTGPLSLVQEITGSRQVGVLLLVPIYAGDGATRADAQRKQALKGLAYAPIRIGDLVDGLGSLAADDRPMLAVYDGPAPSPTRRLYPSQFATPADAGDRPPGEALSMSLTVAGRQWLLVFNPQPRAWRSLVDPLVAAAACTGSLVGLVLYWGARRLVRSRDEADARAASLRALERERRMVLDAVPAMIWYKDRENRILRLNQAAADSLNQPVGALEGRSSYELYPEEAAAYHRDDLEVIATGKPKLGILEPYTTASGEKRIVRTDKIPSLDEAGRVAGVIVFSVDVTEVKRTEEALHVIQADLERRVESRTKELEVSRDRLIEEAVERHWAEELTAGSARILEQVASPAPLAETLDALVRMVESQAPDMLGSVLLLDASGTRLRCAAAPRLPDAYNAAIDGVAIGPAVGSCGTAAYAKRTVIVEDIAVDPLWADYRDLALQHGLRACWSAPILSSGGRALGTFAMYYRTPRRPGLRELELIRTATHLARLAIEHKHAEQESRAGEARFRQVVESAPSGLLVVKADGSIGLVNEQVERMFGYARNQLLDLSVEDLIPERYREGHTEFRRRFMGAPEARSMGVGRELFARRKDGSEFPVEVGLSPIEHDGAPAVLCSIVDVTSRRGLEEQAREQHMALSQAMPGIARLNAGGEYEFVNDFYAQMVGYQPSEMVGAHFSTTLHPEDLPIATAAYERLGKEGKAEFEARAVRKDGRRFYKQVLLVKRVNATGHYIGHHCFMRDITARRQAEEERVRHLEQQAVLYELASALSGSAALADVYETAMTGIRRALRADRVSILRFDADGVLRFKASQGLSETYRRRVEGHSPWTASSVEAQPICIADVGQDPSLEAYREVFASEGVAALGFIPLRSPDRLLGKFMLYYDAPHRFTDAEIHLAQTIAGHVAMAIQRQTADESLAASEARYRALYEQIPSMYFTVAPSGAITSVNRYGAQHLGYEPEELLGRSVLALFHPEDQEAAQRTLDDAFAQPGAHHAGRLTREFRQVKKDGTVLWVRETARILPAAAAAAAAADSEPLALIVCQDVTEAKEAEDALVESESRFRQMAESIQEVFWLSTPDKHEILYVSPAYEQIWGRSCRSLYEQPQSWLEAIHPDDRDRIRIAASAKQADGQYRERYRVIKPDGTVRWIEDWAFPVQNEAGQVTRIAGLATDITERVEAEEAARRFHDELERLVRARTADLDQTRGLLQEVIDSSPDWIFVKDRAHRFLLANRSFAMSQGIAPETMIGRPDTDFWSAELCDGNPEKGIRGFHADDREAFEGRLAHNPHDPATLADGTLRIFDTYKGPLRNERGEVYGVLAYCRDVTEQQAAKAALQEAKDQLELRVSERTAELTKVNQLLQADIRRRELAEAALRQSEQGLRDLYDVTASPGLSFRQQVEAMLDVGRRRFGLSVGMLTRAAGEQLELNIVRSAEGGQEFNGQMVPLCGGPCARAMEMAEPLTLERWGDSEFREHPGHLKFGFESYLGARVSVAGEPYGTICFMSREGRTTPFNEADRTFLQLMARWIGAGLDRQRAEEALQESEARFRRLVEDAPLGMVLLDEKKRILKVNAALCRLVGYSEEEILGQTYALFTHPDDLNTNLALSDALLEKQRAGYRLEKRYVRKDGAILWVTVNATLLERAPGEPPQLIAIVEDITERKRAVEALKQSEEKLRQALLASNTGLWDWNTDTGEVRFSKEWKSQLGYEEGELPDAFETWESHLHPDDHDRAIAYAQAYAERPVGPFRQDFRLRHKNGSYRWIDSHASFVAEPDGRQVRLLGSHTDVTERKLAEDAVRMHEQSIRALYEVTSSPECSFEAQIERLLQLGCRHFNLPIGLVTKAQGEQLEVDYAWAPGTDIRKGTILPLENSFCGVTLTTARALWFEHAGETKRRHHPAYAQLGFECYLEAPIAGQGEPHGTICFLSVEPRQEPFTDVEVDFLQLMARWIGAALDRQQAEDSLRESEARYRRIVETATEGIWTIDIEHRTSYVNAQMAAMLGWTAPEMVGRSLFDFMDDEGRALCERNLERRRQGISEHHEFKFRRKDGTELWALLSTTPILDSHGRYAGALAMAADITELKAAMQQLQDNERRLRAFVEAVPDVSFVLDEDGRYLEVLTPDERLLLRPAAELRGRLAQEVLPPDLAELCVGVIRRTVETGRVEIVEYAIDLPGGRRWFEGRSSLMSRLPGRKATILFMARDITDRVRAAEALKDAGERQRALSRRLLEVQEEERRRLAMDLHDEVGQALTAIKINLLAAQRQGAAAESVPAAAGDSLAILDDLTHRVRDLSLDLRPASLDDLGLAEAVRWLGERQAERAGWALRLEVEEDLADVSTEQATACYRVVQEALTNILRHAGASRVEISLRRLQDTLHLQICDDGRGFDPQAGGQGLGLLTMQERVKHVGGEWAVVTAPGAGTEIRVAIPVAAPVAARTNQEGES